MGGKQVSKGQCWSHGHNCSVAEVGHIAPGKGLPLLFLVLRLLSCPMKCEEVRLVFIILCWKKPGKGFDVDTTSRNECGGFLLLSRCFPRALRDEISLCSGVGGSFHPNANREACRSLPELGSQPHRATPATSWCMSARGGKHRSRPWTAVSLQQHFALPPRKWPAFQQRGRWKCFAAGIFGAEEFWQCCTAGVRVHVWLLCRQSALQWEVPPTIRVSWLGTSRYLLLLLCVEGAHL